MEFPWISIPSYAEPGRPHAFANREHQLAALYQRLVQAGNAVRDGHDAVHTKHVVFGYMGVGKSALILQALGMIRGDLQGGAFNECRSPWLTQDAMMMSYADLEACVTATDAQTVNVAVLNQTLCQLLAGANCTNTMMANWPRQPDSMVDGMPCYTLRARFAAVSANIP